MEDVCQEVNFSYDSNPYQSGYSAYAAGRLAAVEYQGGQLHGERHPDGRDGVESNEPEHVH